MLEETGNSEDEEEAARLYNHAADMPTHLEGVTEAEAALAGMETWDSDTESE